MLIEKSDSNELPNIEKTIAERLNQQYVRQKEKPAVSFRNQTITYDELQKSVYHIAENLSSQGISQNAKIGIHLPRSISLVKSLCAVLTTGASYIPLPPNLPDDRLQLIISESQMDGFITDSASEDLQEKIQCPIFNISDLESTSEKSGITKKVNSLENNLDDLAYVMFTSGSTGKPKGVMVNNLNVSNLLASMEVLLSFDQNDTFLAVTTYGFDISVLELFLPLVTGGHLVIADEDQVWNGSELIHLIEKYKVSMLQATPATWRLLVNEGWPDTSNLTVLCGGEAMPKNLAATLLNFAGEGKVWNVYGPTETTIWSLAHPLTFADINNPNGIPIGKAIHNTGLAIVNRDMEIVAPGETGELLITGLGVTQGYLGQPKLTAERFINADHISPDVAYRTGDLARLNHEGNYEVLGRLDRQIKVSGYRIEPGEIETAIMRHDTVGQVVVKAVQHSDTDSRLAAYVVPNDDDFVKQQQVDNWQEIWNTAYAIGSQNDGDERYQGSAYNSSFTGESFTDTEIDETINATIAHIQSFQPRRILEIGCGIGLLAEKLISNCDFYLGCDLSSEALKITEEKLSHQKVSKNQFQLEQLPADQIDKLASRDFDMVIINSVVQYFPDHDYLIDVITKAIEISQTSGHIFIGDIPSLPLQRGLHTAIELSRSSNAMLLSDIIPIVDKAIAHQEETFLHPNEISSLIERFDRIVGTDIHLRHGHSNSELIRYRFDANIFLDRDNRSTIEIPTSQVHNYSPTQHIEEIKSLIDESISNQQAIIIRNIKNQRLSTDIFSANYVTNHASNTVQNLHHAINTELADKGIHPTDIYNYARSKNWEAHITWSENASSGSYDACIHPRGTHAASFQPKWSQQTTLENKTKEQDLAPCQIITAPTGLEKDLRDSLRETLPAYMLPAHFYFINRIPLTYNNKVDMKALPVPIDQHRYINSSDLSNHSVSDIIHDMWRELLKVEDILPGYSFFELGGNSILLTKFRNDLEALYGVKIPLMNLLKDANIDTLIKTVEQHILAEPANKGETRKTAKEKQETSETSSQKRNRITELRRRRTK